MQFIVSETKYSILCSKLVVYLTYIASSQSGGRIGYHVTQMDHSEPESSYQASAMLFWLESGGN